MADGYDLDARLAFLAGENAKHLAVVLRAKAGQSYDVSCDGHVFEAEITKVSPERVEFRLGKPRPADSSADVTLLLSIFKFDRFEWAIEKCTELGVTNIVPVISKRTDKHLATAALKRAERWRKIAREAAQQSRRVLPTEIADPVKLKDAIAAQPAEVTRLVLAEAEENRTLTGALATVTGAIVMAVGPEGGWTPDEIAQFESAGWMPVSLGANILRAETAAMAACAVVQASLE